MVDHIIKAKSIWMFNNIMTHKKSQKLEREGSFVL